MRGSRWWTLSAFAVAAATVAATVAALLTGCGPPDGAGRHDAGVVTKTTFSWVCVRHDNGVKSCHKTGHIRASRCQAGERWPDCQR